MLECIESGSLEEVGVWTGSSGIGAENIFVGIFNCNQETGQPEGEPLAHGKLANGAKFAANLFVKVKFEGGFASVKKGTKYAFVVGQTGGNTFFALTGTVAHLWKSSSAFTTEIIKPTGWTELNTSQVGFWGGGKAEPLEGKGAITSGFAATHKRERKVEVSRTASVGLQFFSASSVLHPSETTGAIRAGLQISSAGSSSRLASGTVSTGLQASGVGNGPLAVLIGSIAAFTGTPKNRSLTKNVALAVPFTAPKSMFVREAQVRPNSSTAGVSTRVQVAICADGGGKPGEVVAFGSTTGAVANGAAFSVALAGVGTTKGQVVQGQTYWEVVQTEVAFNVLFEVTSGGAVTWKAPLGTGRELTAIKASEWEEGSPATENNGRMNSMFLGVLTPHSAGAVTSGTAAASAGSSSRFSSATTSIGLRFNAEGIGPLVKTKISTGVGISFRAERRPTGSASVRAGTDVFMDGGTGGIKLAVYFGPNDPTIEAEEAARHALPESEPGSGARYANVYPSKVVGGALVFLLHGGGYTKNQWEVTRVYAKELYERGAGAVIHPNYRDATVSVGAFPMELADIEEAIAWGVAKAAAIGADPNKIFLVGGSAGGHLVARIAQRMNASGSKVKGVVPLSGIPDPQALIEEMETGAYTEESEGGSKHAGGSAKNLTENIQEAFQQNLNYVLPYTGKYPNPNPANPSTALTASRTVQTLYSPTRQASPTSCKWLLITAEKDLIPRNQQDAFKAKLESEGKRVELVVSACPENEGKGHAFSYWHEPILASGGVKNELREQIVAFITQKEGQGSVTSGTDSVSSGSSIRFGKASVSSGFVGTASWTRNGSGSLSTAIRSGGSSEKQIFSSGSVRVGTAQSSSGRSARTSVRISVSIGTDLAGSGGTSGGKLSFGLRLNATSTRSVKGQGSISSSSGAVGWGVSTSEIQEPVVLVCSSAPELVVLIT